MDRHAFKDKWLYAMYRGDKFVDVGTKEELMKKYGYTYKTISWYMNSRKAKARAEKGNMLGFYRVCLKNKLWENEEDE